VRTIPVKVRRLDTILSLHEPDVSSVDILAADVEGWELNVMRGFSVEKYHPRVVILENLFKKDEYVEYMRQAGYSLWRRLEPNDVYVDTNFLRSQTANRSLWSRFKALLVKADG
jgi:hypothetical protein